MVRELLVSPARPGRRGVSVAWPGSARGTNGWPLDPHVHRPAPPARTVAAAADARVQPLVVLEPRGRRPVPPHRPRPVRAARPQPGETPRRHRPGPLRTTPDRRGLSGAHGPRRAG